MPVNMKYNRNKLENQNSVLNASIVIDRIYG